MIVDALFGPKFYIHCEPKINTTNLFLLQVKFLDRTTYVGKTHFCSYCTIRDESFKSLIVQTNKF